CPGPSWRPPWRRSARPDAGWDRAAAGSRRSPPRGRPGGGSDPASPRPPAPCGGSWRGPPRCRGWTRGPGRERAGSLADRLPDDPGQLVGDLLDLCLLLPFHHDAREELRPRVAQQNAAGSVEPALERLDSGRPPPGALG